MRSNSRTLFFAIFAVLLAANLFAPAASLCKKCRKNKAAAAAGEKPNEHDELFDSQKDEKTHVSQPGGQPKKEHSSEEESEEEKETTPTPLATAAPKRARRDQELRRDRELGEIATFTGHQKSNDHNDRNQHDRNRHHYHTIKRRQADDAHATHAHAADASCGEEGGGGAKLNAEAKVDGATAAARRRRRHALHARPYEREQREERARAVDTNVFAGPDSAQTDASGGGAPILVRKTRGIDHDKWRCPHDAEEEIMKMTERSDPPRKHEKRDTAASDDDDDRERERNAPLKYPSDVDLTDFLARKMEEHSRQPKGPFGGHRRGPVGPFPEPDIHLHGQHHRAHGTAGAGALIADRHFDLAEGIRRKLDADTRKWEARAGRTRVNADGSVDQRRAREMEEASAGSEDSSDSEPGATKMYKARELGEGDNHRVRGFDSELGRKKWLAETGPEAGASLAWSRGANDPDTTSQTRTGADVTLARSLKATEPEASDEEEEDETVWSDANDRVQVRVRRPRSSDRHEARLGEDVNRKLESELNREGRADESFVGQSPLARGHQTPLDQSPLAQSQPVENPLAYLGYQGHHPHKHHKRPPTTRTTEDADGIRLGEDVRRKLESDLNRAGRAGDPNM